VHGHTPQQVILDINAQWLALSLTQQQQPVAINNAHWLALSITQQEQLIAVNNAQWLALSSHLPKSSGHKFYPHGAPQL